MTNDISENEVEVSDFARCMTAPKVEKGVSALLEALTDFQKKIQKSQLLKDDTQVIYLQIEQFHIPHIPKAELRVTLPHPLSVDKDVCLIVKNNQTGKKKANERAINNKMLRGIGFTRAITIIPIDQLCGEHKQNEEKEKFAQLYETYLVDRRLWSVADKSLGIRFSKAGFPKNVIPVNLTPQDLKKKLEAALSTSVMNIHPEGDTFTMQVGYSSMTLTQLSDNVLAAMTELCENGILPGGFDYIRAVHVKAERSMAIPIYLSCKKDDDIAIPVRKVKIPTYLKVVEDEPSTMTGGIVRVNPEGDVQVSRELTAEDRMMMAEDDGEEIVKSTKDYKVVEGELSTMIGGIVSVNPEGDVQVRRELTAEDRMTMAEDEGEEIVKSTKEEVSSDPGREDEEPETKPLKRKLSADGESNDEEVEAAEENHIKEKEGGRDGNIQKRKKENRRKKMRKLRKRAQNRINSEKIINE